MISIDTLLSIFVTFNDFKNTFSVFVRSGHHIANLRGGVHQLAGKIYADSEY